MEFSDKVRDMARDALRHYLATNPDSDIAQNPIAQQAWLEGYMTALHTLGIDLEDNLFDGLE